MAWCQPGDKPLSEPMMVRLPTHICITRPQWVNTPCQNTHFLSTWITVNLYLCLMVSIGLIFLTIPKPTHTNGFMQERHNSIANALELYLSCTNPSILSHALEKAIAVFLDNTIKPSFNLIGCVVCNIFSYRKILIQDLTVTCTVQNFLLCGGSPNIIFN